MNLYGGIGYVTLIRRIIISVKKNLLLIFLAQALFSVTHLANAEGVNSLYEQALIAFQNDKMPTSVIHLKNALKLDNKHMPSRVLLAQVLIEQGNGIAAELELNKARAGNVDYSRLVTLYGHAYLLQHRYEEVLEVAKPSNRGSVIESELFILSGQAYIGKKQYSLANKAFEKALLLTPNNQMALLGRAQIFTKEGKYNKALSLIEQALNSAKSFINGWILKATILQKLNRPLDAIDAIDRALLLDASHLNARLTKAMLHIGQRQYQQAKPHVDYILKEIPNEPRAGYLQAIINASLSTGASSSNTLTEVIATLAAVPENVMRVTPDYYYLAGLTNFQFGNLDDARRYLRQYLTYAEFDIDSIQMIATIDLEQGEVSSARNLLTKANLAKPDQPSILMLLGMTYLQLQDNVRAQYYFEKVLERYPESEIGITNLARSRIQSGNYQLAIETLLKIKDNDINGVQIKLLLIYAYQNTQAYDKAVEVAKELTAEHPGNSFFHQKLGLLYGLKGELVKARDTFHKALLLDPSNLLATVHLARMDNIAKQPDKAIIMLSSKLVEFPKSTLLMAEMSDAYFIQQDLDNALLWINKAYAQSPNDFDLLVKLANALVAQGKIDKAIDAVDIYIGQNSKKAEALLLLSSLYHKIHKYRQSVATLKAYVDKAVSKAKALVKLAIAQLAADDRSGAIHSYKKAIVADDKLLPAYLGLVNLIIEDKNEKFALSLISSITKLTQSKVLQATLLGDLYLALDNTQKSKKYYLTALQYDADQKQAILGLYRSYKRDQQLAQVIPYLEAWLVKTPDDLHIEISLADSYKGSGQWQKSADYYESLLTKYGQRPILLNNLAGVYFALEQHDKAKKYAEQAYGYLNGNVAIIDTLAWIESRMGNHKRALALFRQALIKDFGNAETKYHLAVTLFALDRKVEAKNYLIESVESQQMFSEKAEAKALLADWLRKENK